MSDKKTPFINGIKEEKLRELGIDFWGYTKTSEIEFSEEVRSICEKNQCGNYGKSWTCPPAVGTFEECKNRVMRYENVLVYACTYEIEDSFDFEGMRRASEAFSDVTRKLFPLIEKSSLLLSGASCGRCVKCAYPSPCRHPETLSPAVESYGILVYKTAEKACIPYRLSSSSVNYFGIICF